MVLADKKRGFAFVEFEEGEDSHQALTNLNKSEFFGRVLSISVAKPESIAKNRAGPFLLHLSSVQRPEGPSLLKFI